MVLNYCFYKIHQLLIIVNVNNKQKPFTHPTVNPFFNDYFNEKMLRTQDKLNFLTIKSYQKDLLNVKSMSVEFDSNAL